MTVSLIIVGLLAIALLWLLLVGRGDAPEPTARRRADDAIDHAELEQAERDVQEAPDEESVKDWGPGASKPPIA